MSSLLDSMLTLVTPDKLHSLAAALGVPDDAALAAAAKSAAPALVLALARQAAAPEGPDAVMKLLASTDPAAPDAGSSLVDCLLSDTAGAVANSLSQATGFANYRALLNALAPTGVGLLAKLAQDDHLDAQGVADLLQADKIEVATRAISDPETQNVLEAFRHADEQVAIKAQYDAEQWQTIAAAPVVAAVYTVLAGDRKVTDKEWQALSVALDPLQAPADGTLLIASLLDSRDAVLAALGAKKVPSRGLEGVDLTNPDGLRQAAIKFFGRLNRTLLSGPSEDASRFKESILVLAQKVAEAQAEGGFLGIAAHEVNPAEFTALNDIAAEFGYEVSLDGESRRFTIFRFMRDK